MNKLKVAVIGTGHLGRIHARLLSGLEGVELVGVVDPVEASRRQAAQDYHTTAFADHRELFGKIDAAVVATPTRFHHRVGLELLEQGIHLLVEKPLATSLSEAEDLVRAARRQHAVLQVGHVERFNPALALVAPRIRAPKYIEAERFSGYTGRSTDIGVVLDLMIHDIDVVLSLAQSPVLRVEALGISVLGRHEDVANARLIFENGCVANLSASRVSFRPSRRMQIWSHSGFAGIDFAARSATFIRPHEPVLDRQFDVEQLSPEERSRLKDRLFEDHLSVEHLQGDQSDAITAELHDFADSIRHARPPRVTGEQACDALAVAEHILLRITAHAWDGVAEGPTGPFAMPTPQILPGPHWNLKPHLRQAEHREAG